MPLISTSATDTPQERLSLYRAHGVTFGVLLVPWDALSRIQREAALHLATERGRGLAELRDFRRDYAHADDAARDQMIGALWLTAFLAGPIHLLDAEYWTAAVDAPDPVAGPDPRLEAFRAACLGALGEHEPPPPPGPGCRCPSCEKKYPKRRRGRR